MLSNQTERKFLINFQLAKLSIVSTYQRHARDLIIDNGTTWAHTYTALAVNINSELKPINSIFCWQTEILFYVSMSRKFTIKLCGLHVWNAALLMTLHEKSRSSWADTYLTCCVRWYLYSKVLLLIFLYEKTWFKAQVHWSRSEKGIKTFSFPSLATRKFRSKWKLSL